MLRFTVITLVLCIALVDEGSSRIEVYSKVSGDYEPEIQALFDDPQGEGGGLSVEQLDFMEKFVHQRTKQHRRAGIQLKTHDGKYVAGDWPPGTPQKDYKIYVPNHDLTKKDGGPPCQEWKQHFMTPELKAFAVKRHNELRAEIANGKGHVEGSKYGMPWAADMNELVWDDELALLAHKHADQCIYEHEPGEQKRINRFAAVGVGQNLAISQFVVADCSANGDDSNEECGSRQDGLNNMKREFENSIAKVWYKNEMKLFNEYEIDKFGGTIHTSRGDVGHFTQLIWASTTRIGCAYSSYKQENSDYDTNPNNPYKILITCDYGESGNSPGKPIYRRTKKGEKPGSLCKVKSTTYPGLCKS